MVKSCKTIVYVFIKFNHGCSSLQVQEHEVVDGDLPEVTKKSRFLLTGSGVDCEYPLQPGNFGKDNRISRGKGEENHYETKLYKQNVLHHDSVNNACSEYTYSVCSRVF